MSSNPASEKDDPRDRIIKLNGKDIRIEKTKHNGGTWRIKKPLRVVNGELKKIAGVTHVAVKPADKTWKNFKNIAVGKPPKKTDIGKPDNTGKALDNLIKRIVELKEQGWENTEFKSKLLFKDADNISKYLTVAEWIGLWDYDKQQAVKAEKETVTHLQKGKPEPLSQKIDKRFHDDPLIIRWKKRFPDSSSPAYQKKLFNALKILDMTPDELNYTDYAGDEKDLPEEIEERIFPLRVWAENPYNRYPSNPNEPRDLMEENRFVKGTKKTWVDPNDITRLKSDTGWEKLVSTKGKNKGLILIGDRNNNVMYNFAKVIRNFINANRGIYAGMRLPETHILSQEAPSVAQYGDVHLSWTQIQGMRRCLLDGIKDNTKKVRLTKIGKTFSPLKDKKGKLRNKNGWKNIEGKYGEYNLEHYSQKWSSKSYWEDAYFFFMLGIEMGFRAEEGFDIIAETPFDEDSSGVEIVDDGGEKYYFVSLYTRKTEQHKEGRIHKGLIPNSTDGAIVKKLIDKRLAEIKKHKGIDSDAKYHALIGEDNKYTKIQTIDLPTDEVVPYDKRRQIIKNILRHCYENVEAASKFYYERPIHAIRHVFAQYWLNKSGYNYTFVMRLGHWSTLATLLKSYGKMDDRIYALDHNLFANIDASKPFAFRRKQIADAQKDVKLPEPEEYVPTATTKEKPKLKPDEKHFSTETQAIPVETPQQIDDIQVSEEEKVPV